MEELKRLLALEPDGQENSDGGLSKYFKIPTDEEQRKTMEEYNLSWSSKYLIEQYAGKSCFYLNEQLRSLKPDDFTIYHSLLLAKSLVETKQFNSRICCRYCRHMDKVEFDHLKTYKNKIISFPQFLSSSKTRFKTEGYFFLISTHEKSNGYDIEHITKKHGEKEVLFSAGTKFKILDTGDNFLMLEERKVQEEDVDLVIENHYWEK